MHRWNAAEPPHSYNTSISLLAVPSSARIVYSIRRVFIGFLPQLAALRSSHVGATTLAAVPGLGSLLPLRTPVQRNSVRSSTSTIRPGHEESGCKHHFPTPHRIVYAAPSLLPCLNILRYLKKYSIAHEYVDIDSLILLICHIRAESEGRGATTALA